ncbi:MAG: SET domain-containing protein [Methylococcales bacterium]|jgi:uncharacterized protein|nr:SET domain-containing protein [Methylococcales bacterium]
MNRQLATVQVQQIGNDLFDVVDNIANSYLSQSKIHGTGLYAKKCLLPGDVLGELDGQVIPWAAHEKYALTYEWNALSDERLLVRSYRTRYSYINHARTPNLVLEYNPIRVVVHRAIDEDEELTLDYRLENLPKNYIRNKGQYYL